MAGCAPSPWQLLLGVAGHCCGAGPVALRRLRRNDVNSRTPCHPDSHTPTALNSSSHGINTATTGSPTVAKKLPTFLWLHIAEFLQCGVVAQLCTELRGALQWRHVVCSVNNRNLRQKVDLLRAASAVQAIALHAQCLRVGDAEARILGSLAESPSLMWLTLNLRFTCLEDRAVPALCLLRGVPRLTTLVLDLGRNHLEEAGARALTALRECPTLTSLEISLRCNQVGSGGAAALAALSEAPALTTLSLDLDGNDVDDIGLQGLVALAQRPTSLQSLTLFLSYNFIGDAGARGLADLSQLTSLSVLHLHLRSNQIGDGGAKAVATLLRMPSLRKFSLDLRNNQVGRKGRSALTKAFKAPRLQCDLQLVDEDDSAGGPYDSPLGRLTTAFTRWRRGYEGLARDSAGTVEGTTPSSTPKP